MGKGNTKSLTKVVYKPDSQSTEEFIIIVNPEEYNAYKGGDTSIALALVVDSFDIFVSEQGNQGLLGKASKQQLDSTFGTTNEDEAVKKIIELGTAKPGDALPKGFSGHNDSQGASKGNAGQGSR